MTGKKYDKGTLGWLREKQKIKAKKDGFDNVDDWLKWKNRCIEEKYGKEFAEWARENKGKHGIENKWINLGCKNEKEYIDRIAQGLGYKDHNEQLKEWRYKTGRSLPAEDNPECSSYFGDFTESLMIQTFEDVIKMPYGNPGFDWICKNGDKIDNKGVCLGYNIYNNWSGWRFTIRYNNIADWFILSAWDNRSSLNPLHVWAFHKNDMVKYRIGNQNVLKRFCDRELIAIPNTPEGLKEFEKYEINNRLIKLKELCNGDKKKKKRK